MPHAALFVVQEDILLIRNNPFNSFNAARGFVCGARMNSRSMLAILHGFNAARGFVCGASCSIPLIIIDDDGFNAARGFVCGASTMHKI